MRLLPWLLAATLLLMIRPGLARVSFPLGSGEGMPPSETVDSLSPGSPAFAASPASVRTGVEVLLRDSLHLVRGRRVGLITNPTAVIADGTHAIDLLNRHPEVSLAVLFAPEHGLRGGVDAGVRIADGLDPRTGLPIRSLYGRTLRPTPEMLRGVDVLLFDMLDISARTYTYLWTMTLAMEAAAEVGLPFLVLDRPNPVTGRVSGPLPTFEGLRTGPRITGHYPVPFRHGMTPGEIARYVNEEYRVGADLRVIPLEGWNRGDWYDRTGLPWIDPSPNIRSLEAALNFSGLGPLEATALSLGRGTSEPFMVIGAPWLDGATLLARLRGYGMPGVELEATRFTPNGEGWMQFRGQSADGIRIRIIDRDLYDPSFLGLVLLTEIHRLHPSRLGMREMKHVLDDWTTAEIRGGVTPERIAARWRESAEQWEVKARRYRLYE